MCPAQLLSHTACHTALLSHHSPGHLAKPSPNTSKGPACREEVMVGLWTTGRVRTSPIHIPLVTGGLRWHAWHQGLRLSERAAPLTAVWATVPPGAAWPLREVTPLFCYRMNHSLWWTPVAFYITVMVRGVSTRKRRGQQGLHDLLWLPNQAVH